MQHCNARWKRPVTERKVVWTVTARDDLASIIEYLAAENLGAAQTALGQLQQRAASLGTQAERGRIVPELREVGALHYRELIERPWRIVYRLDATHVSVMAVLDSRRDLQTLLLERLIRS